jgi:hypothetical protein
MSLLVLSVSSPPQNRSDGMLFEGFELIKNEDYVRDLAYAFAYVLKLYAKLSPFTSVLTSLADRSH